MPVIKALLRRKLVLLGLFIMAFVIMAVFAPWVAPYSPEMQHDDGLDDIGAPLGPNDHYWLGTDTLGRDLLSRLIFGARATLIVAILANTIAVAIGVLIGVTAGYARGWAGNLLMRFTDLMTAFPALLLAILLAAVVSSNDFDWLPFSPNLLIIMVVIAAVNWVQVARVTYTETISLSEREFIVAEKSLGAGTARILFKHMLPHVMPTVIVYATLGVATTSLTEATLSFLGIGVQPPTPSWGNMAFDGQTYFDSAPWLVFFPSLCIALLALSFNLIGDALRDILDPTLRGAALMAGYLVRRLSHVVLVLIGVSIITFLILHALPHDPARQVAGRTASPEQVAQVRHELGLDQPLPVQYWHFAVKLAQGDLGRSYVQRSQVSELMAARLPATFLLMLGAIFFELLIGLPIGAIAAFRRNTPADQTVMLGALFFVSTPQFLVAYVLLYIFGFNLQWFPTTPGVSFATLILPSIALGLIGGGWYARMMRSSIIEVLRQDYVRTARAKGLRRARIVLLHVVPNGLLPIIAMVGLDIGYFMSGIVVVESVFGWPGIGQLAWQAIQQIDIPIIMGVTLVAACAIVLGNLLADLVAPLIDPRIKLK